MTEDRPDGWPGFGTVVGRSGVRTRPTESTQKKHMEKAIKYQGTSSQVPRPTLSKVSRGTWLQNIHCSTTRREGEKGANNVCTCCFLSTTSFMICWAVSCQTASWAPISSVEVETFERTLVLSTYNAKRQSWKPRWKTMFYPGTWTQ